ncbi:MAG: PD40 domain-containing protein [Anaerolineales bacterium]|nr:PD40 domain-containing protein [Anaerolineales bacterium]
MFNYLIGQTIDRYQVTGLLGQGRLGAVLRAHDPTLQREVALKLIDLNTFARPDAGELLLQRARAAARLDHPGLVKVHDFGRLNGLLYVVMDYLPGGNLADLLRGLRANNQWPPLAEAVGLIRQVARTLGYLSRQGAPARGLKPADLKLKPEPADGLPFRAVLTSLGLAGASQADWVGAGERGESSAYAYWSPEEALGQPLTPPSAVYSLGALLYELAVGWQPFPVKTLAEAVRAHTRAAPPAPRARRADLPAPLEGVILRALAKDPAARYPDPAALALALDEVQALLSGASPDANAGAWMVSLLTAYQRSLAEMTHAAPAAPRPADPNATVSLAQGRVKIVGPGGAVRYVRLTTRGLTLGRDPGNDLVLTDGAVAPQHARVEFDGRRFLVTDLSSPSGTFLGGARLLPGLAEAWVAPAPLLIGDSWLYLESGDAPDAGAAPARPAAYNFDGAAVDAHLVQFSANGRLGVYVEVAQLTLTPGQKLTAAVVVVNAGPTADHFSVAFTGLPPNWVVPLAPPASLALAPGAYQRLRLTLDAPRTPHTRAGRYTLLVRVASQANPTEALEAKLTLTLPAFKQFASEISAALLGVNEPLRLTLQNQGNTPEIYSVGFEDASGELRFDPPSLQLNVPEGHTGVADLSVGLQRPRLIGRRRQQPFTVRVADSSGQAQRHTAELVSFALVPPWIPLLIFFMGCLLLGVLAFAALDTNRRAALTSTAAVSQTAAALGAADSDNDGLANLDEVRRGTDALNPDTDGDGLFDGAELIWNTDPRNPDTDGDTLPDGYEVNELHSSPTNPDTDGDGQPDNLDPDPGQQPTPTPSPTLTATPTLTPSATETGTLAPATDTAAPTEAATATLTLEPPTATVTPPPTPTDTAPAVTVTPAGGVILFYSERDAAPNLYRMYSDGSYPALLSPSLPSTAANTHMQWSAAAQRIVFQSNRDGNDEIYVMHLDGSGPTRLTDAAQPDTDPAWSPDGLRLAFVSERDGNAEIYIMNADGSNQTRLTNTSAADTDPVWSPDGLRLVFVSERDGNAELYGMQPDGSGQTRLTTNTVPDSRPAWSPNGAWLAFVRDTDANAELWLMAASGGGELRLTNNTTPDDGPVWSPSSALLAFTSERDGNLEIYLTTVDGGTQTRLTNTSARDALPIWSPDAARLAFVSERDGNPEIYVMLADGTGQTRLTNDPARDEPAGWLP